MTQFGNALQHFWYHANAFGLGDNSKMSYKKFNRFQLKLRWAKIWKRLRRVSIGCRWISPKTHFVNALQHFWYHANEFGLGENSKTTWNNFNRIQSIFGWDTIWKGLRTISIECHWFLPMTQFGNALQHFWYHANEFGLGDNSKNS